MGNNAVVFFVVDATIFKGLMVLSFGDKTANGGGILLTSSVNIKVKNMINVGKDTGNDCY